MKQRRQTDKQDMLQGTLDMLILRTVMARPAHGHTIANVIERSSEDVLQVEQGSLYPALHRLEDKGWLASYWGTSENNRKAKFYKLTVAGRERLTAGRSRLEKMGRGAGAVGSRWCKRLVG